MSGGGLEVARELELTDGISHFKAMERREDERRTIEATPFRQGRRRMCVDGDVKPDEKSRVAVDGHRPSTKSDMARAESGFGKIFSRRA